MSSTSGDSESHGIPYTSPLKYDEDRVLELMMKSRGHPGLLNPFERRDLFLHLFLSKLQELDLKGTLREFYGAQSVAVKSRLSGKLDVDDSNVSEVLGFTAKNLADSGDIGLAYEVLAAALPAVVRRIKAAAGLRFFVQASSVRDLEEYCRRLLLIADGVVVSYHWPLVPYTDESGLIAWAIGDEERSPLGLVPFVADAKEYFCCIEDDFRRWARDAESALVNETIVLLPTGIPARPVLSHRRRRAANASEPDGKIIRKLTRSEYISLAESTLFNYLARAFGGGLKSGAVRLFERESDDRLTRLLWELPIPYLDAIPLAELIRIREGEAEAFLRFRNALIQALREASKAGDDVERAAQRLRRELIDEGLVNLNERMREISSHRSLRLAGVTLSSIGLVVSATLGAGATSVIPSVVGAGGLALLLNELAELIKDRRAAKRENPMYFLWKLGGSRAVT